MGKEAMLSEEIPTSQCTSEAGFISRWSEHEKGRDTE